MSPPFSRPANLKGVNAYPRSRTAAKTAHPDVGGSEEKMAALNQAYEVLSDAGTLIPLISPLIPPLYHSSTGEMNTADGRRTAATIR